jgi:hypothetical protein
VLACVQDGVQVVATQQSRVAIAQEIMARFMARSGVTGDCEPVRYLWTDAFAVCNLLALAHLTEQAEYLDLTGRLVDQVHHVLGQHRADDHRSGWISGLADEKGQRHPTAGGLRIGKPLPERPAGKPLDDRLEWNRDGQYFHYLTQWAHALNVAAWRTGEAHFSAWGRQLLQAACDHFIVAAPGGGLRMVWKMSIDLSRPLVSSMGHHDPIDGYVRCMELRASALAAGATEEAAEMASRAARLASMIRRHALASPDPLGIGGLLVDAAVLAQLIDGDEFQDDGLLDALLAAVAAGLHHYRQQGEPHAEPGQRLAFRELGLSIGLHAVPIIEAEIAVRRQAFRDPERLAPGLRALADFETLGQEIESFWLAAAQRESALWLEHQDINEVMLATALVPEGTLRLSQ